MTLMGLCPLWDESLDPHKASSELLGHQPAEDVQQVLGRRGFAGTWFEPRTPELLLVVHNIICVGG